MFYFRFIGRFLESLIVGYFGSWFGVWVRVSGGVRSFSVFILCSGVTGVWLNFCWWNLGMWVDFCFFGLFGVVG